MDCIRMHRKFARHTILSAAPVLLCLRIWSFSHIEHLSFADGSLSRVTPIIQCFLRHDAKDFWKSVSKWTRVHGSKRLEVPVRIFWNANSTLLASRAEVSINERLLSPTNDLNQHLSHIVHLLHSPRRDSLANCLASSVGTARKCLKSLLFPTNIMTMFASAWSLNSFNHRCTFSYVWCFEMS